MRYLLCTPCGTPLTHLLQQYLDDALTMYCIATHLSVYWSARFLELRVDCIELHVVKVATRPAFLLLGHEVGRVALSQPPEEHHQPTFQPGSQPTSPQPPIAPQQPNYGQPPISQLTYPPQGPQQSYGYSTAPQGSYPYPPQVPQPRSPYYQGNNWLGRQTRSTQTVIAIVSAIVIVVVILGIASTAGNGSNSSQLTNSATVTATSLPTETPLPTATVDTGAHVSAGQTIEITAGSDIDVATTLVSVQTSSGSQFEQPKSGDVYVICDVKIENKGPVSYDYNEFDFYLLDGNGNISENTFVSSDIMPNPLNSGTLTPGGHVEGQVAFEAVQGDHAAQMTWQPTFETPKDKFTWKLGL